MKKNTQKKFTAKLAVMVLSMLLFSANTLLAQKDLAYTPDNNEEKTENSTAIEPWMSSFDFWTDIQLDQEIEDWMMDIEFWINDAPSLEIASWMSDLDFWTEDPLPNEIRPWMKDLKYWKETSEESTNIEEWMADVHFWGN